MCGIAGYVQQGPLIPATLEAMMRQISHRGPDGFGVKELQSRGDRASSQGHSLWNCALGHRRLAIIDLEGGGQPMSNLSNHAEDSHHRKAWWITYNGEVYNHQALRTQLETRGHRFTTRSDTEAMLHLVAESAGEPHKLAAAMLQLDGMFAFAMWDEASGRLILARDRVGIKPLYYAMLPQSIGGQGLAFASELRAVLAHPYVPRTLCSQGLASYFFLDYAQAPYTLIEGVLKLEPGTFLCWKDGHIEHGGPVRYWSLEAATRKPAPAGHALVPDVRKQLETAVESQLLADVPIGVFLSGGLDSSLVGAIAQQAAAKSAAGHANGQLKTFTIKFEDPRFDESGFARQVSEHIGSEHIEETLSQTRLIAHASQALDCLDEPIADPSIIPTYVLSSLAARHVKVALGGDGGDELWGGYPTYKAHRLASYYQLVPRALREYFINPLVQALPVRHEYQPFEWKAKRFALRWDDEPLTRHLRWMSNLDTADLAKAMQSISDRQLGSVPRPFASKLEELQLLRAGTSNRVDLIGQMLMLDFSTYLPGSVLSKVDRASMAHGLEVRPPLLANSMVDLAYSIPASIKMPGGTAKGLLKQVAQTYLPAEIIHRKKKGFAIPLASWVTPKGPLRHFVDAAFTSERLWQAAPLSRAFFEQLRSEHDSMKADRSRALWALAVLHHWYERL